MGSMAAAPCHLVAVPFPGRGHVNSMLNLCRILAARDGVSATVVVTEEWLGLLGGSPALEPGIRLEAIPNVIPSEHGRAADWVGFVEAVYTKMEAPFEQLLDRLGAAPAAIVADTYVPWAVSVGNRRGVPVCILSALNATIFSVHYHFDRLPVAAGGSAEITDVADPSLIESYIHGLKSIRLADLEPSHTDKTRLDKILEAYPYVRKAQCVIFSSFYELESSAIDSLRQELHCPVFAVGPCVPFMSLQENNVHPAEDQGGYMAWLDEQPANSVLYISLGSFLSVSSAQLEEIATGLAQSKVRFLWVLRDTCSRVQELIHGSNCVIVPWCDQLKVLRHPSLCGFFTHCGYNSTLEALYAGVPMLALPIALDQPINSRLIVDEWKVGYGLKEKSRTDGVVGSEVIAETVKKLMSCDSSEGVRRASLMKEAALTAIEGGGSSHRDVTSFIDYISHFKS
ncbi:UDP-glycosyltransferase 87A2 [Lolium perenne]|uniref:UDP-glycosyltransferase 87A2 n=1 Tax=Lolium perenne TaxID=4522 RepID=UPI0021EA7264|nr:UDP-glycosyltransferase 87A2-like [Lolium perenne]